jgi:hypothetical protein
LHFYSLSNEAQIPNKKKFLLIWLKYMTIQNSESFRNSAILCLSISVPHFCISFNPFILIFVLIWKKKCFFSPRFHAENVNCQRHISATDKRLLMGDFNLLACISQFLKFHVWCHFYTRQAGKQARNKKNIIIFLFCLLSWGILHICCFFFLLHL